MRYSLPLRCSHSLDLIEYGFFRRAYYIRICSTETNHSVAEKRSKGTKSD